MAAERVTAQGSSLEAWIARLAEPVGDPGGGAASGVMLALSAALTAMVAGYEARAARRGGAEDPLTASIAPDALRLRAADRRRRALEAADADAVASRELGAALRLPEGPEREEAVRAASLAATAASVQLGDLVLASLDDLAALGGRADAVLIADVAVALAAARAALAGARANAAVDLADLLRHGSSEDDVRREHGDLVAAVERFDAGLEWVGVLESSVRDRIQSLG